MFRRRRSRDHSARAPSAAGLDAQGFNIPAACWAQPARSLLLQLGSSVTGLSSEEAALRLRRFGTNTLGVDRDATAAKLLARQFSNPLVLILIFAALVAAGLANWLEAAIILSMVLGSTLLGFAQEYRASTAMAALCRRLTLTAKVLRNGQVVNVPFGEIVVGDVVRLSAGAVVPADAIVLSAQDLLVGEAPLTGESFPVEKRPGELPSTTSLSRRTNMVFHGTSVRSGVADVLVVATGRGTQFGVIAERLAAKRVESDFARGIRRLGAMLIRVMIAIVLLVLIANQLLGRPFLDSLLFSVALGVGLSPELLPAIMSVTLADGARRLASKGVIVRRLEAIENLGGMTVFCTDKTGTLTEGEVRLEAALSCDGQPSAEVGQLAFLNAAFETGIENPLDQAILDSGRRDGLSTGRFIKVDEIPYDFLRKRLTIVVQTPEDADARLMITKGAFSNVLALCSSWMTPTGPAPLDAPALAKLQEDFKRRGEAGFRVLALATRRLPTRADYAIEDETDMCLAGLLAFSDPPKPDAAKAIRDLADLGVAVKVISGDNRYAVAHVGGLIGLDAGSVVTGEDIAQLREEALWNIVERTTLFAEVDPQAKERLVRALQRTGHAVGYLGDGVNDAPALYAADVGISVEQAVDVARESADIVLTSRNLDVLREGIEDGRRTFANTMKFICITISGNFGNMVSMAIASPFLPFLPLAAKQILLNNLLSDLPMLALASDTVTPDQIRSPLRLGSREIQRFMLMFGLISSLFDLLAFAFLLWVVRSNEAVFQTSWFVMSLLTELAVTLVLRTQGPAWRNRPGRLLAWATALVAIVAFAAPYLGEVSTMFGFQPLPPRVLAALVVMAGGYVAVTEAAKLWFFRRANAPGGRSGEDIRLEPRQGRPTASS